MNREGPREHDAVRLTRFLIGEESSREVTPYEAALIVLALGSKPGQRRRCKRLVGRVAGDDITWIMDVPLADVMVRLLALKRSSPEMIGGDMMARLARRLIGAEAAVGGPYRDNDGSMTFMANAAVLQFFTSYGSPLPRVGDWLARNVPRSPCLTDRWIAWWPYDTGVISVAEHGPVPKTVASAAAAVCLMASEATVSHALAGTSGNTRRLVDGYLTGLSPDLRGPAKRLRRRIGRVDAGGEVSEIARRFADSLPVPPAVPAGLLDDLSRANFYAWMAYTVYDGLIDGDGDPADLPIANIVHRQAAFAYAAAGKRRGLTRRCFDDMDAANAWELAHCRFAVRGGTVTVDELPDYGDLTVLARRAGVHALGPLTILEATDAPTARRAAAADALSHYLIARQLSDDLHDWVTDVRVGHISPVVAYLLHACRVTPGTYALAWLVPLLKRAFWESGLAALSDRALGHVTAAYRLEAEGVLRPDGPFIREVLDPLRRTFESGKRAHDDSRQFADAYAELSRTAPDGV